MEYLWIRIVFEDTRVSAVDTDASVIKGSSADTPSAACTSAMLLVSGNVLGFLFCFC